MTTDNPQGMWLHLLPLAFGAIVIGTAIPVELRPARVPSTTPLPIDFLLNVALYVPLGLALWRRPRREHHPDAWVFRACVSLDLWTAAASGALLSTAIEVLQTWFVNRQPSVSDVLANTVGTAAGVVLGLVLARRARARRSISLPFVFINRRVAAAAVVTACMVSILLVWRVNPGDLSNWDPDYELVLGNEVTGDRPFHGVVSALALVPDALTPDEVRTISIGGDAVAGVLRGGRGRWLVDAPLALDGTGIQITNRLGKDFVRAIVERNAFTVVVRGATADIRQDGPARFVSFSRDPYHRNFDVGQERRRVRFRVRTPATGVNGGIYAQTGDVLEAQRPTTIVASYDGDIARIYVDGRLEARTNLSAATCLVRSVCDSDLPLAAGLLGAWLAIGGLAAIGHRRGGVVMVVVITTAIAAALAYVGPAGNTVPGFHHWFAVTALAGAAAVSVAAVQADRRRIRAE